MDYRLAVIPGDGIGPEITAAAAEVLAAVGKTFGHKFALEYVDAGGCAIDRTGTPLPEETLSSCLAADSVLLGAVGGPKWDVLPPEKRPERALLGLRKEMGLFANLRPAALFPQLAEASPLKERVTGQGIDMLVVRELTGGIYFGKQGTDADSAYDTEEYSAAEVERIARTAFSLARQRKSRVTSVDKANVLASSRLWRAVVTQVHRDYQDVALSHMYVDNAAMQIAANPSQFDVLLTNNMFGDILSDLAAAVTGSIGMLASASTGAGTRGLYEPIHGSAPDIVGRDTANPLATISSCALLLRTALGLTEEAEAVEAAISAVLDAGLRTPDIWTVGMQKVGTRAMGRAVAERIGAV